MKIGVEEEFIVVDPKTLFHTPAAFQLASCLAYQDFSLFMNRSVELPLSSRSISSILKNLKKGFSIIEIKTDPYEDIDLLRDEIITLREQLCDIAVKNDLFILPVGLHPMYSSVNSLSDNCAALHIHIDYQKGIFEKIRSMIPFLISISTNSPFINGKIHAMSNRLDMSPHVGIPTSESDRSVDLLHNKKLNTIEIRVLDSQITIDESIGVASIAKAIAESDQFQRTITNDEYIQQRNIAVKQGFQSIDISSQRYEELHTFNKYAKKMLDEKNGSDWQIDVYQTYGLPSVICSLWESFKQNEKVMTQTSKDIDSNHISTLPLLYFIPYSPFFFLNKYKKCHQDIDGMIRFLGSMFQ